MTLCGLGSGKGANWCPAPVPPQCPGTAALGWWPEGWSRHPAVPPLLCNRFLCITHLLHPFLWPCCRLCPHAPTQSCCSPCRRKAQSCLGVSGAVELRRLGLQSVLPQREPLWVEQEMFLLLTTGLACSSWHFQCCWHF